MGLHQVVYSSRPAPTLTLADVEAIVQAAQRQNAPRGITGRLLVATDEEDRVQAFMQWLEGPLPSVRACLERIVSDPRHTDVQVVRDTEVALRSYPEWSMGLRQIPLDRVEAALAAEGFVAAVDIDGEVVVEIVADGGSLGGDLDGPEPSATDPQSET